MLQYNYTQSWSLLSTATTKTIRHSNTISRLNNFEEEFNLESISFSNDKHLFKFQIVKPQISGEKKSLPRILGSGVSEENR